MTANTACDFDYVLVGAGLANGLLALSLLRARPDIRIALVEREQPGGEHTWSFHESDVPASLAPVVAALAERRWDDYDVVFPDGTKAGASTRIPLGYASFRGTALARALATATHDGRLRLFRATAMRSDASAVTLDDGTVLTGRVVVDATGPRDAVAGACGFQKFVGLELRLADDSPFARPVLMDATVPQQGGYRFFYVLPFEARRVLVEDTLYARDPALDDEARAAGVLAWAEARGLRVDAIERRERGVLPLPWAGATPAVPALGPLRIGYGAGLFHPTTGYSAPVAFKVAEALVAAGPDRDRAAQALTALVVEHERQARFFRLLNRLMFRMVRADEWWRLFARFHTQPSARIARFYRLALTAGDRARLLCGRPPRGLTWPVATEARP